MTAQDVSDAAVVVRILESSGRPAGTGFLVGTRLVATCAHIVTAAIGGGPQSLRRPCAPIAVDFPSAAANHRMSARVCGWVPEYADGRGDIAVLHLDAAPPAAAVPPPMRADDGTTGPGFRMLGAADVGPGIASVSGHFWTSSLLMGWRAMDVEPGTLPISDRFSGAPVWDAAANMVVGMATVPDRRSTTRTAFVIPIQDVLLLVGSLPARAAETAEHGEPDLDAEPVVGVYGLRTFTVIGGKLRPVFDRSDNAAWRDGTCTAKCGKGTPHRPPADGCTCGVYCFRDLNHLRRQYSRQSASVVGVVALEGRVIEGDSGWRAQAARVVALWERTPGVVDVLPGVHRYRHVDDMVHTYPGLTVDSSPRPAAPRPTSPHSRTTGAQSTEDLRYVAALVGAILASPEAIVLLIIAGPIVGVTFFVVFVILCWLCGPR
ncbi:trypsin-like peptidase domain-containing protein [Nocardia sp. 2YAB30]|uniref:trypsin-like peptidase domain-containing protein n=1 Tax=Nocardia sp. 2YAB30 TaxID=3233022 RepID=UPI003F9A7900